MAFPLSNGEKNLWHFHSKTVQAVNPLWIPVVNAIKHGIPSQPLGLVLGEAVFTQKPWVFETGGFKKVGPSGGLEAIENDTSSVLFHVHPPGKWNIKIYIYIPSGKLT